MSTLMMNGDIVICVLLGTIGSSWSARLSRKTGTEGELIHD